MHTIDDLRRLLVQPEQTRLESIEQRLGHDATADSVATVLADAAVKAREEGPQLTWAFEPVVVEAFRDATTKDPRLVTDVVAPIIGPAIRKALARAMDALMDRVNAAFGQTLSLRSLKWRFEAVRTGRPFGEIVLSHTLLYRVEQIFLIRRDSALVLQHLVAENVPQQDADQVAAMLTAIESFVHEAFAEKERLDRFTLGELTCLVEHGPRALLVAVVRGIAPVSYRLLLGQTLERIHLEFAKELECVQCDPAPFVRTQPALRVLLHDEQQPQTVPTRRSVALLALMALGICAAIVIPAIVHHRESRAERTRFEEGMRELRAEPGLVVTSGGHRHGVFHYEGLRDPLARSPARIATAMGLPPARVQLSFAPFYSLDPRLLERRVRAVLGPPSSVSLSTEAGVVRARGSAPRAWIADARARSSVVPGVTAFDDTQLADLDALERARSLRDEIDHVVVPFVTGDADPARLAPERLDVVASKLRELAVIAPRANVEPRVGVEGRADPRGTADENQVLGENRRREVIAALEARGVPAQLLNAAPATVLQVNECEPTLRGKGAVRACDEGRARARTAAFRVQLEPKRFEPQRGGS